MGQSHFVLDFPLAPGRGGAALRRALTPILPAVLAAAGALGTVHYSCFALLSAKTLLFLGHFDGEFGTLITGLAAHAGPAFDTIFRSVATPPPSPVAANGGAFAAWAKAHLLPPLSAYSAYPTATVANLKSLAATNGRNEGASPFFVILPAKSHLAYIQLQLFLRSMSGRIGKEFDAVGTSHFAQIVPLENDQIGFFALHDGTADAYVADLTKSSTFDVIFKFTKDPPPSPIWQHPEEFRAFVIEATRETIGLYQAVADRSVRNITKRAVWAVG